MRTPPTEFAQLLVRLQILPEQIEAALKLASGRSIRAWRYGERRPHPAMLKLLNDWLSERAGRVVRLGPDCFKRKERP